MLLAVDYITMLVTVGIFNLFNALLKPSTMSLISRKSTMTQGSAMGIAESYMSLGRMIGPLWAGYMLDVNLNLPYISGSVLFLAVFLVSLVLKDKLR